jgi:segregation and condensation protein A
LASSVFASSFASTLELVREGVAEMQQRGAFEPIYLRRRGEGEKRSGSED